jgi:(1->4)-alpha-D-glucan 1-alpha-D-glucosylmutase
VTASIPSATYRLQFHRDFTFAQATAILDYLKALGISHIYSSPYFQASESSMHGYDVADHNRLNPAVGDESDYVKFIDGLRERGLGQILDFVPNHMGISEPINRWWMDVLENGPCSEHAKYFDIEWHPLKQELENKVLLPILGDRYGRVLEKGEFKLAIENGAIFLSYHEAKLPLNPRSYPQILDRAAERLAKYEGQDFHNELLSISSALSGLPQRAAAYPEAVKMRAREKEVSKQRLARLMVESAETAKALETTMRELEGREGDAASFDSLHELLCAQVYRLAFWRVAAEEINYRRFFDINTLAAIRTEVPEVFEASHELVFKMLGRGDATGLRIDHIDGLWNPRAYLENVQKHFGANAESESSRPLYLLVEKILGADEWLPEDWPVHGTTGYEFGADAASLLVAADNERLITDTYKRFTGQMRFEDLVYEKKLLVARMALASEIAVLGHMLDRISEKDRHYRDFTLNQLTAAVRETIACFPVYRTYVVPDRPIRDEDRLIILKAIRKARRRNPSIDKPIFDYLAKVLLLELLNDIPKEERDAYIRFTLKFQQLSGPVMAKGLEDTAFYIYNRLAALNEVGGEPGRFGLSVADFHARCDERLKRCPHTLLATSTHDTKRSEDVRARMLAISELPDEWREGLTEWSAANAAFKSDVDGHTAPSPNEEYLLYQTLAGAWPLEALNEETRPDFIQRIQAYMVKVLKEAKVNSSWVEPNEEWENATKDFVAAILDPKRGKRFQQTFLPFSNRIAELGAANSLAQTVLKCTTLGVPDIYQGCEIWDFSLVDPDNRRPVDYQHRQEILASLESAKVSELVTDWSSGRIKLFVLQHLLRLRIDHPELFLHGDYRPLPVAGKHQECVVAFERKHENASVAVVVSRATSGLGFPAVGQVWNDTMIDISRGAWREIFTQRQLTTHAPVRLADLLAEFPVACLLREKE